MENNQENEVTSGSFLSDIFSSIILLGLIVFGLWLVIHFGTRFLAFLFGLTH